MQSCVENICPNEKFSLTKILDSAYQRSKSTSSTYDQELQPLISEIITKNADGMVKGSERFLAWIDKGHKLTEPGQIRVYNVFATLEEFSKFKFTTKSGKTVVDGKRSREAFPKLNDQEFWIHAKRANAILAVSGDLLFEDLDPARIKMQHGDDFKKSVETVLDSYAGKLANLKESPDLNFLFGLKQIEHLMLGKSLRDQLADSQQVNAEIADRLQNLNVLHNILQATAKDADFKALFDSGPIDIKKAADQSDRKTVLQENLQTAVPYQTGIMINHSATCLTAFNLAQETLPSEEEIRQFRDRVKKFKDGFANQTKGLVCTKQRKAFQKEVNSWQAYLPMSKEQFTPTLKASFARISADLDREAEWTKEIETSKDKDALYAISLVGLNKTEKMSGSVDGVCEAMMPTLLPDAASLINKGIVAGPLAVKLKEAEGITFHELGHKLYQHLKTENSCVEKSKFSKIQNCLAKNHGIEEGKENIYESEDFADLISASLDKQNSNFSCLFARKLRPEEYGNLSLRNEVSSDEHSSDLFRLLHINFVKTGKIPEQCHQALEARGEKPNFVDCLKAN